MPDGQPSTRNARRGFPSGLPGGARHHARQSAACRCKSTLRGAQLRASTQAVVGAGLGFAAAKQRGAERGRLGPLVDVGTRGEGLSARSITDLSLHRLRTVRVDRRLLDRSARYAPPRKPRIVAVAAILAAGIALAATLWLSAELTAAHAARAAARAASGHDRARIGPAHSGGQARPARRTRNVRFAGDSPFDTLPFPANPADRATRRGEVPSLYADGLPCSTGCRPSLAQIGWPLAPFHQQHPIRAGLNELRPASLHVGVDIQARDGAAVYAIQPGVARVLLPSGPNARVQVGSYIYWHITPAVRTGELARPFETVLGTVMAGYGHIAFSELDAAGEYVNPLRPGGRVLEPYVDAAAPVIGAPAVAADGQGSSRPTARRRSCSERRI